MTQQCGRLAWTSLHRLIRVRSNTSARERSASRPSARGGLRAIAAKRPGTGLVESENGTRWRSTSGSTPLTVRSSYSGLGPSTRRSSSPRGRGGPRAESASWNGVTCLLRTGPALPRRRDPWDRLRPCSGHGGEGDPVYLERHDKWRDELANADSILDKIKVIREQQGRMGERLCPTGRPQSAVVARLVTCSAHYGAICSLPRTRALRCALPRLLSYLNCARSSPHGAGPTPIMITLSSVGDAAIHDSLRRRRLVRHPRGLHQDLRPDARDER